MERTELKTICDELMGFATPETQARMSEIILTLSENNDKMLTEHESLTNTNRTLTENNEALRNVNNKLLMKVGEVPPSTPPKETGSEISIPNLKYEDLFNDKGEII